VLLNMPVLINILAGSDSGASGDLKSYLARVSQ
jgi:hypothetical protein